MKDSRTRLFEVMGRLDKTFKAPKAKLNEEFEPASPVAFKQPMGGEVGGNDFETEKVEQTPEEKLEALTAKVDELYALLHGESEEAEPEEGEEDGDEGEEETDDMENLQEWNFDKEKGEKKEKEDDDDESEEKEEPNDPYKDAPDDGHGEMYPKFR